jgi:GT2 family glycosyltransferase
METNMKSCGTPCRETGAGPVPGPTSGSRVSVILVTWNQQEDALACIASLEKTAHTPLDILVVDNGSRDDTVSAVRRAFPHVSIIEAGQNLGFAAANNLGIRAALDQNPAFVFLLNTDTVVDPEIFVHLLRAAESDPGLGVLGPKMYFFDEPARIWFAGGRTDPDTGFSRHFRYGEIEIPGHEGGEIVDCSFVTGAGMFVRTEVFRQAGVMDETFFHTTEDNDLCIRASRAGYRLACVPRARLWHKVRGATGGAGRTSPLYAYYEFRNRFFLLQKHSRPRRWIPKLPRILYNMIDLQARLLLQEKNPRAVWASLQGFLDFVRQRSGRKTTSP